MLPPTLLTLSLILSAHLTLAAPTRAPLPAAPEKITKRSDGVLVPSTAELKMKMKTKRADADGNGVEDDLLQPEFALSADPEHHSTDGTTAAGSIGTSSDGTDVGINHAGEYENVATTAVIANPIDETYKNKLKLKTKRDGDDTTVQDVPLDTTTPAGSIGTSSDDDTEVGINHAGEYENVATTRVVTNPVDEVYKNKLKTKAKRDDGSVDTLEDVPLGTTKPAGAQLTSAIDYKGAAEGTKEFGNAKGFDPELPNNVANNVGVVNSLDELYKKKLKLKLKTKAKRQEAAQDGPLGATTPAGPQLMSTIDYGGKEAGSQGSNKVEGLDKNLANRNVVDNPETS